MMAELRWPLLIMEEKWIVSMLLTFLLQFQAGRVVWMQLKCIKQNLHPHLEFCSIGPTGPSSASDSFSSSWKTNEGVTQ